VTFDAGAGVDEAQEDEGSGGDEYSGVHGDGVLSSEF